ncbi:reverse transcriptase domain-containing protein [Tanacetum coccineum]
MGRNLEAYVDDMVIKSKTELEMIKDVEETLLTLKKINMKLNPKKWAFGIEEGKFLGYIVTFEGTRANPKKEKAIVNMPSPTNIGRRSILGDEEIDSRTTNLNGSKEGRRTHGLSISGQQSSQRHFVSGKTRENKSQSITRLRRYFQGHTIKVITDKPISLILNNREATGRLAKWGIELETYGIKYALRSEIKGQVLADFLEDTMAEDRPTQIKTNGSDEGKSEEEAGLIFIDPEGSEYSYALRLNFYNSSNDAEYEELLAGSYKAKGEKTKKYKEKALEMIRSFSTFQISHILREDNKKADALSKIAVVQCSGLTKGVMIEELNERSVDTTEVNVIVEKATRTWMTPIQEYIKHGILPEDASKARMIREKARNYTIEE